VEVGRGGTGLGLDGDLGVVDAGEVAGAGGLVLLGLEGEGVGVDTGEGRAGVVVVGLDLVEVLASLLLEAVLAVEHELEGVDGTGELLSPGSTTVGSLEEGGAGDGGGHEAAAGLTTHGNVGREDDIVGGGEVPEVGAGHGTLVRAPDELLDGVVVGEADLLGLASGSHGVGAGVLDLLDEVLVTLLGEAATLLGVKVDVVTPDLEGGAVSVLVELGGEVEVEADLVVLERDEGKGETGIAVEKEDQRKEDLTRISTGGGHLTPRRLLGLVEVELGVEAPPLLVVLVDALTTDGKLDILDGTLRGEAVIIGTAGHLREAGLRLELDVHVGDEITVARDGDGDATVVGGVAVNSLLDVLHREVGVAAVDRLEESNLGVASQVNVLGTISDELHKTTGHFESIVLYRNIFFQREKTCMIFPVSRINVRHAEARRN